MGLTQADRGDPSSRGPNGLTVVMYHYVREVSGTRFPGLNAMTPGAFKDQVATLVARYEMASLQTAMDFLSGQYLAERDLCLLTFDDGLREHHETVAPVLEAVGVSGLFLLPTASLEDGRVLPVHKSHFLAAFLGFEDYRARFLEALRQRGAMDHGSMVDPTTAARTYRWDAPAVGQFKYLINYVLDRAVRDAVVDLLFIRVLGDERKFANELYLTWDDARKMQSQGMLIGGHTHTHPVLADCPTKQKRTEISSCARLLRARLDAQDLWPFAYPFGKSDTYDLEVQQILRDAGFHCSFTTEVGSNLPGQHLFEVKRVDPKDV